jgi:hypothetical protein
LAHATTIPNVTIVSCYDGDTCRVDLPRSAFNGDWAYNLFSRNIPIRVEGIELSFMQVKAGDSHTSSSSDSLVHPILV